MLHPGRLDDGNEGIGAGIIVWEVVCVRDDMRDGAEIEGLFRVLVDDDLAIVESQFGCQLLTLVVTTLERT